MHLIKISVAILPLIFSLQLRAVESSAIVGLWLAEECKAIIEIELEQNQFKGKIAWVKKIPGGSMFDIHNPDKERRGDHLVGKYILKNFRFDGSKWMDGTIYDPENGKTYSSRMSLDKKDHLNIRGYIWVSLIGRTTTWKRYKKTLPTENFECSQ